MAGTSAGAKRGWANRKKGGMSKDYARKGVIANKSQAKNYSATYAKNPVQAKRAKLAASNLVTKSKSSLKTGKGYKWNPKLA